MITQLTSYLDGGASWDSSTLSSRRSTKRKSSLSTAPAKRVAWWGTTIGITGRIPRPTNVYRNAYANDHDAMSPKRGLSMIGPSLTMLRLILVKRRGDASVARRKRSLGHRSSMSGLISTTSRTVRAKKRGDVIGAASRRNLTRRSSTIGPTSRTSQTIRANRYDAVGGASTRRSRPHRTHGRHGSTYEMESVRKSSSAAAAISALAE
jgi:hypothetical protein